MHGNYQQNRSNHWKDKINKQVSSDEPKTCTIKDAEIRDSPETMAVVTDCTMLNIREKPDANAPIVVIIPAGSELMVNQEDSTESFYKVCTAAGIEGFCMKQYISLK